MILPEQLEGFADSPAVMALSPDDKMRVASDFNRSRLAAQTTRKILLSVVDQNDLATDVRTRVRNELILASIALGMYSEAIKQLMKNSQKSNIWTSNLLSTMEWLCGVTPDT